MSKIRLVLTAAITILSGKQFVFWRAKDGLTAELGEDGMADFINDTNELVDIFQGFNGMDEEIKDLLK